MNAYLTPPEQPEREFIAKLKSHGFKRLTGSFEPRSTLAKGETWVGYVDNKAFIFGRGTGWQPFDAVMLELDVLGVLDLSAAALDGALMHDHDYALLEVD